MKIVIPNLVFVILIAILTGYLTFLTTKGGLTNNRFSGFWRRLTLRGRIVIFVLFFMLLILIAQEYNNKNISNKNDFLIQKERDQRDSIITEKVRSGIDANRKKLFEDLSKAFAKQELRIDTVKKTIDIIRDSLKTTINNYSEGDPVLMIDRNGILLRDTMGLSGSYYLTFKSIDEGSTNYNIITYLLTEYRNGAYDLSKINFFPKGLKVAKNAAWETGFGSSSLPVAQNIYVYLKGTYTTLDKTKMYYVDDLYVYSSDANKVSLLLNSQRNKIIKIIISVPKKKLGLR